jgi:hypothetical protein
MVLYQLISISQGVRGAWMMNRRPDELELQGISARDRIRRLVFQPSRALRVLVHASMVLFALAPSLMGYSIYLTDIPNAVARITINLRLIADPSSSEFYAFKPVLIPNMALDVWGLLFGPWIGVENAVLIFIMLVIVSLYAVTQLLRHVIVGGTSLVVGALSLVLIHSGPFRLGLMNYELGAAITLAVIALTEYQITRPSGVTGPGSIAARSVLCLLSVMCSVFPTALYVCYVIGRLPYVLQRLGRNENGKQILALGIPFLPVVAFLAVAQDLAPGASYAAVWKPYDKMVGIVTLLYAPGLGMESPIAIGFAAALVLLFAVCRFWIAPSQRLGLILMAVLYLLLPSELFDVGSIDGRLAQPIALLLIASTELVPRSGAIWAERARLIGASLVLFTLMRPLASIATLQPVEQLRHSMSRLFLAIPSSSRVLVVTDLPRFRYFGQKIWHLPLLSAAEHPGDILTGTLFTNFFTRRKQAPDKSVSYAVQLGVDAFPDLCKWTHVLLIGQPSSLISPLLQEGGRSDGAATMLDVDRTACATAWNRVPLPEELPGN